MQSYQNTMLSKGRIALFFAVLLAYAAVLNSVTALYVPDKIGSLFKGNATKMSIITGFGSFIQGAAVIAALLSDRSQHSLGRRRPFIAAGACAAAFGLLLLSVLESSFFKSLFILQVLFVSGYYLATAGAACCQMLATALLADLVPEKQSGIASGFIALYMVLGSALGYLSFAIQLSLSVIFPVFLCLLIITACLTLFSANETPYKRKEGESGDFFVLLNELKFDTKIHSNFLYLQIGKFILWISLGCQMFFQFFLRDKLQVADPMSEMAKIALGILASSLVISIPAGVLCDKVDKKKILLSGVVLLILAMIVLILSTNVIHLYLMGILFAAGQSLLQPADMSLCVQVIPNKSKSGSYLSLSALLIVVGMSVGVFLLGNVLSIFKDGPETAGIQKYTVFGYNFVFGFSIFFMVTSLFLYSKIDVVTEKKCELSGSNSKSASEELLIIADQV
ncbi:hypothetical protein RCL1_006334 [Eukaryota sp. TZLM3-RCL]